MEIHVRLPALLLLATLPLSAQTTSASAQIANNVQTPAAQTLLGQGWGVDHVGVAVREMPQAQHDYEELGFKVGKGGRFPEGEFNSIVSFQQNNYVELLSVSESTSINKGTKCRELRRSKTV
jgi:hypothetical protein